MLAGRGRGECPCGGRGGSGEMGEVAHQSSDVASSSPSPHPHQHLCSAGLRLQPLGRVNGKNRHRLERGQRKEIAPGSELGREQRHWGLLADARFLEHPGVCIARNCNYSFVYITSITFSYEKFVDGV